VELPRNIDGYVEGKQDDDIWGIRESTCSPSSEEKRKRQSHLLAKIKTTNVTMLLQSLMRS
jgi:hypothetical protein